MKTFLVAILLSIALNAFAGGPVITENASRPTIVGPVSIYLSEGHARSINVTYIGYLTHYSKVSVGVVLNGKLLGTFRLGLGRGHISFGHFNVPKDAAGDLELFFVNEKGEYDSDFGRNYSFTLECND